MNQEYQIITDQNLPAPVFIFDEVDSTFETARKLENHICPWASVLAKSQLQGRGQLRRKWIAPPNNLYATICLPKEKLFTELTCSTFTGTMFVAAMRQLGLNVLLKWPNDIVMEKKHKMYKVGGILIEENAGKVWAGVGINIFNSPEQNQLRKDHALPAAHISELSNYFENHNPNLKIQDFWCSLVKETFSWYNNFSSTNLLWENIANSFLMYKDQHISFLADQELINGYLCGISADGGIYIENNGIKKAYFSGSLLQK